jgi:hypothetical protein
MDLTTTLLPFLCGSLTTTAAFTVLIWRQERQDAQLLRHIKVQSYNEGWKDATDDKFRAQ